MVVVVVGDRGDHTVVERMYFSNKPVTSCYVVCHVWATMGVSEIPSLKIYI